MDTKQFILKKVKFPGGKDAKVHDGYAHWHKRHGHGGANTISRVNEVAKKAGFTQQDSSFNSDATGDRVSRGTVLTKQVEGGTIELTYRSYYGVTSYENSFTITVGFRPSKPQA